MRQLVQMEQGLKRLLSNLTKQIRMEEEVEDIVVLHLILYTGIFYILWIWDHEEIINISEEVA